MKTTKSDFFVAAALRTYAYKMCTNPENFSVDEGRALDRALRSCRAITALDRVWVRWGFVSEQQGWDTTKELKFIKGAYRYPESLLESLT